MVLKTLIIASAAILAGAPAIAAAPSTREAAEAFYIYSIPLVEMGRHRDVFLKKHAANSFVHHRELAGPEYREVTTPNVDTIYSEAFLDLRAGPVTITIPASGKRYASVALLDMYTNNFAYGGTRETGGKPAVMTVVGPGQEAPKSATLVARSPTPWAWAIVRVLAFGEKDLAAAHHTQDGFTITAPAAGPKPAETPGRGADSSAYLAAARRLLAENPPPAADAPALAQFREVGLIGQRAGTDADVAQGFDAGRAIVTTPRRPGNAIDGWIYPRPTLGRFGTEYLYRALVAITGLGALSKEEATYLRSASDADDGLYDGATPRRLHFAVGQLPPVDAFWSVTLYEPADDGGFYFFNNSARVYAIGDRTPGLHRNSDGSLDIWVSQTPPAGVPRANWLPAPATRYQLSFRLYLPRAEALDGRWRAPKLETISPTR